MLRLLDNCQTTHVYCSLYNLLRKYKDILTLPKLPGLVIKCLLKLAKHVDKMALEMDFGRILTAIHEYLLVIDHENKTPNDDMGIRITKTIINELVKIKQQKIWEDYKVVQAHPKLDNHISRWIKVLLESPQ